MVRINHNIQIRTLCNRYERSNAYNDLQPASKEKYDRYLNDLKTWAKAKSYETLQFDDIEGGFLQRYRKHPTTHNDCVSFLKMLFNWAMKKKMITSNVMQNVSKMKVKPKEKSLFTENDYQKFKNKYATKSLEILAVSILYYTGMRQSDVRQLSMQNFQNGVLKFMTYKTNQLVIFPIPAGLQPILSFWQDHNGLLFPNREGEIMDAKQWWSWFNYRCKKAGVVGKSSHSCRYTFITNLVNRRVNDLAIQAMTGHKTLAMITRYSAQRDRELLAASAVKYINW